MIPEQTRSRSARLSSPSAEAGPAAAPWLPPPRWRRCAAAAPPRGSCPPWAGRGRRGPPPLSPCDESISPHCHVSRAAGAVQGRAGAPRPDPPACLLFLFFPFPCFCPAAGQRRGGSARRLEGRSAPLPPPPPPPQPRSPRAVRGLRGPGLAAGALPPEGTPLPADVRAAPPPARGCVSTGPAGAPLETWWVSVWEGVVGSLLPGSFRPAGKLRHLVPGFSFQTFPAVFGLKQEVRARCWEPGALWWEG